MQFGYNNTMKYSVRMVVSEGAAEISSRDEWNSLVQTAIKLAEEKNLIGNDYAILDGPKKLKIVVVGKSAVFIMTKEEADAKFLPDKGSMN